MVKNNSRSTLPVTVLLFLSFLFCHVSFSQNILRGKITDVKTIALKGATVYIPDLKIGAISNADGNYEIKNIPKGKYLLEVSYMGFATAYKEITIKDEINVDFSLEASAIEAPEVVVTGVSSGMLQKKNPVPVSFVEKYYLMETSSNNIMDALSASPGVSQITMGPAISKPVIRGLGYNRVVVVDDGVRQEGQQFGDEFGIEIDPYTVDKAQIMRGPASLNYGSDERTGCRCYSQVHCLQI